MDEIKMSQAKAVELVLAMGWVGKSCKFCGKVYETPESIDDEVVYVGDGQIACGECWAWGRDNR